MLRKFIYILFIVFNCIYTNAQQLQQNSMYEILGVKQGLSQGMVLNIIQDEDGLMWFSTKDGLNKYDGYKITVFRNDVNDKFSLPDNSMTQLLQDDNKNIWVGTTTKGLCLFDKRTEKFYSIATGLKDMRQQGDHLGSMTARSGVLFLIKGDDVLLYDISKVNFNKDGIDALKNLKLLFSFTKEAKSIQHKPFTLNSLVIPTLMPNKDVWIIESDSVIKFSHNAEYEWKARKEYIPFFNARYVFHKSLTLPNSDELLVVNCDGTYLYNYTTNIAEEITLPQKQTNQKGLGSGNCFPLEKNKYWLIDKRGNYGILDIATRQFTQLEKPKDVATYLPFKDANDIYWLGTNGYGIFKYDKRKSRFNGYNLKASQDAFYKLEDNILPQLPAHFLDNYSSGANYITIDKDSVYWVVASLLANPTSNIELFKYNTKNKALQKFCLFRNHNSQSMLYADAFDRLWLAEDENAENKLLYKIDKKAGKIIATNKFPNAVNSADGSFVNNFYVDKNKVIWMATKLGLYSFNEDKNEWKNWRNIPIDKTTISNNKILSICPDPTAPTKYLWLGTEGSGFSKFEIATGKCTHFTSKDGLPNNVCYGILSDSLGNLWISTNYGLSCFSPSAKNFWNFTEDDGLIGNEFNRWQFMKLANGNLMFGGVEGVTIFNPNGILEKQKPVPLMFTGLSISNKNIHFKTDSAIVNAPIEYAKTITLPVEKNNFTISFASLEYRSNQNKYYSYKLVGLDKDFTNPSTKNEASYTNLSPGKYTLIVKGTNTDGVWCNKEISIQIIVPPHWYQTWWFYTLIALIVIYILYAFNKFKIKQAIKLEKLRNRIAIDLHDEIGSTLSSIALFSEAAKKMNTNDSADKVLNKINTSTTEMMEAMSDIVWAVNNKNDKLENVMNRMRDFAVQICEPKEINLHFTDNKNIANVELDMVQRKNTYLIFKEAINNAVKYSHCKNIWVEIDYSKNSLQLSIKDDGKGFNTNETTVDNKFGGNGLKNMQQRANEINAVISIDSKINLGTLIGLKMPL